MLRQGEVFWCRGESTQKAEKFFPSDCGVELEAGQFSRAEQGGEAAGKSAFCGSGFERFAVKQQVVTDAAKGQLFVLAEKFAQVSPGEFELLNGAWVVEGVKAGAG